MARPSPVAAEPTLDIAVSLHEIFEDALLNIRRDSDTRIRNRQMEHAGSIRRIECEIDLDAASRGEFDSVAE